MSTKKKKFSRIKTKPDSEDSDADPFVTKLVSSEKFLPGKKKAQVKKAKPLKSKAQADSEDDSDFEDEESEPEDQESESEDGESEEELKPKRAKGSKKKTTPAKKVKAKKNELENEAEQAEEQEFYHLLQDARFKEAMTRIIKDYVNNNPTFRSNLVINGHANFLLVTLVCSTPTLKTVFYITAANKNDDKLTSRMNEIAREFLEQFGISPAFHVTDGLHFFPHDGRVLDLVHLSTGLIKMFTVDCIHAGEGILFVSKEVFRVAISSDRCKSTFSDLIKKNAKVPEYHKGRGEGRFDPGVFSAQNEMDFLTSICETVCGPSGADKQTAQEKFKHHREYVHRFLAVGRLLWRRLTLIEETELALNADKIVQEVELLLPMMDGLTPIFHKGDVSSMFNAVVHTLKTYLAIFKKDKLYPADDFFHAYDYQVVETEDPKDKFLLDEYQNGRSYGTGAHRLDLWCGFSTVAVAYPTLGWTYDEVSVLLNGLD